MLIFFGLHSTKSGQISNLKVRFQKDSNEKLRNWRRIFISLLVDITCYFLLLLYCIKMNPMIVTPEISITTAEGNLVMYK